MRFLSGLVLLAALLTVGATTAQAQFSERSAETEGAKLGKAYVSQWRIGVSIKAQGGPCSGMVGTIPVPIDWPEQRVRVIDEKFSPNVRRVSYRELAGAKQMIVEVPQLLAGEEATATVTFEVTRNWQLPPTAVADFKAPKKINREINSYMAPSPFIESSNAKIVKLAKETAGKKEGWEKVEALYDVAREKIAYKEGDIKGAAQALQDGTGDCEEISSLFIAMCRATKIPARMVWVPGHCYPEFYLEDGTGKGYWFPCQAAGARAFGGIPEQRPILQKGDNFRDPDRPGKRLRYLSEYLKGSSSQGKPQVKFIREKVSGS